MGNTYAIKLIVIDEDGNHFPERTMIVMRGLGQGEAETNFYDLRDALDEEISGWGLEETS